MRFHECIQGVYFDDLDALGILHNSRYLVLFERTIGSLWQRLGWSGMPDAQLNPDQFHLVRANHVEYLHPITGVCEVRVRVWVQQLGKTSLTFGLRVQPLDEDVDHATGYRVLVCVEPTTRRPVPWSDAFRKRINAYVESAQSVPPSA